MACVPSHIIFPSSIPSQVCSGLIRTGSGRQNALMCFLGFEECFGTPTPSVSNVQPWTGRYSCLDRRLFEGAYIPFKRHFGGCTIYRMVQKYFSGKGTTPNVSRCAAHRC